MIETQRDIRVKLGVLVVLVSMAWLSSSAAEASKILFKSEVAGTDLPFSDAALIGDTVYISGRGGFIPGTLTVPKDPKEEARLLMEDFKSILKRAEMTMDDLVYITIYCPDLTLYQALMTYTASTSTKVSLRGHSSDPGHCCSVCALKCRESRSRSSDHLRSCQILETSG